jgi:hypothetical protein
MTIAHALHATALLALAALAPTAQALTWNRSTGDVLDTGATLTLTSAYLDGAEDQPFNVSGQSASDIGLVEIEAGVPAYALDLSSSEYGTEGSLASLQLDVAAHQTISFRWTFTTQESLFEDHAFAVIGGQVFTLATRTQPGGALQSFSHTFDLPGAYTLSVGVIDTVDVLGVSRLTVQDLQVSSVPEPAIGWLALAGGLVLRRKLRRS